MSSTQPFDFDPNKTVHQQHASLPSSPFPPRKNKETTKSKQASIDKIIEENLPIKEELAAGKTKKLARSVSEIDKGAHEYEIENAAKMLHPPKKEKLEPELVNIPIDSTLKGITASLPQKSLHYVPCEFILEGNTQPDTDQFCLTGNQDGEFVLEIEYEKKGKGGKPQMIVVLPQYLDKTIRTETGETDFEEAVITTFQLSALAKSTRYMWMKFEIETLIDLCKSLQKLSAATFANGPKEISDNLNKAISNLRRYLKL